MPTYTFYDSKTKKQWDDMISNDEREKFLEDNPHVSQIPGGFVVAGDHLMGVGPKVDGGFTENMQRIAGAHPGSPLADRFGGNTQTHKEIKTLQHGCTVSCKLGSQSAHASERGGKRTPLSYLKSKGI